MSTEFGPITDSFINRCLDNFENKETQNKILEKVLNPLLKQLIHNYSIYLTTIITLIVLTTLLQIITLIIITQ
jgi:hypothetical protein